MEDKENPIRKSGVNFKFLVTIVLLMLFFCLFAEPVTEMPVPYALHLSEISLKSYIVTIFFNSLINNTNPTLPVAMLPYLDCRQTACINEIYLAVCLFVVCLMAQSVPQIVNWELCTRNGLSLMEDTGPHLPWWED